MLRFEERNIKWKVLQKTYKNCDFNVENIVNSKLVKTKTNSKYLIGTKIDKAIRSLVLIMSKMSWHVTTFKGDKNSKLMSFRIENENILGKYKAIWSKIENLKNIELIAMPVYDDKYIKTKIRTYVGKVYTNFRGLSSPEDYMECESFTVISIDSFLVYENKHYLQVYLNNCAYETSNREMVDYL